MPAECVKRSRADLAGGRTCSDKEAAHAEEAESLGDLQGYRDSWLSLHEKKSHLGSSSLGVVICLAF